MTFLQREMKKVTDMSQLCSMVTFVGDVGYSKNGRDGGLLY